MGDENNKSGEDGSVWNEQQQFSFIFFRIHAACRIAQIDGNYQEWKRSLQAKISHGMGVCSEDEEAQKQLKEIRQELDNVSRNFNQKRFSIQTRDPYIRDGIARARFGGMIEEALFDAEGKVDCILNRKMPFLKIEKKENWDDFQL